MSFMSSVQHYLEKPLAIPGSIGLAFLVSYLAPQFSKTVSPFGDLYLSFFLLAIIPYLSASIILSVSNLFSVGSKSLNMKKWGLTYLVLYCVTVGASMAIANFMDLGGSIAQQTEVAEIIRDSKASTIMEVGLRDPLQHEEKEGVISFLVESIPNNIFKALSEGHMVQVIMFSIFFGVSLGFMTEKRKKFVIELIDNGVEPFRNFIEAAVLCLPIGIFFIMSKYISSIKDPTIIIYLWKFLCTAIASMLVLAGVASIVVWKKLKTSYIESLKVIQKASIIALSTSDSLSALPSLLEGVKEKTKLRKDSVNFLIPMGVSLFEFGALFYYSFLTVFVAQVYGVHLDFSAYVMIAIGAYFAAAAETAVPLASLSIIFIPLGLPMVFLTLFLVVIDWLSDPFRTLLTVVMNYTGSVIVADVEN